MQKKTLRTTALLLCFCILLLAVPIPNTFARNEKRSRFDASKSRFLFVNTGDILANVLFFLAPHANHHVNKTSTPPVNETTQKIRKKLTAGRGSVAVSDD